jgi:hypothetical protein
MAIGGFIGGRTFKTPIRDVLGIASGIAFGFVVQRVGATNADRMT